jgi:hypothetical protein
MSCEAQDWLLALQEPIFAVIPVSSENGTPALLILIQTYAGWRGSPDAESTGKFIVMLTRLSICFILVL